MKQVVVPLVLAAVLAVGTWFLFSNAHIDILPCQKSELDTMTNKWKGPESGTCSLLGIYQDKRDPSFHKSELTGAGWAVGIGVIVVLPGVIGLLLGRKLTRPKSA
jgi:hypothetical protein